MSNTDGYTGIAFRNPSLIERTTDAFDCTCCGTYVTRPVFLSSTQGHLTVGSGCAAKLLGWVPATHTGRLAAAVANRLAHEAHLAAERAELAADRRRRAVKFLTLWNLGLFDIVDTDAECIGLRRTFNQIVPRDADGTPVTLLRPFLRTIAATGTIPTFT